MNDIANQEKVAEIKQKFLLELNKYPDGKEFAADIVVQVQGNDIYISSDKYGIYTQIDMNVEVHKDSEVEPGFPENQTVGFLHLGFETMCATLESALNDAAFYLVENYMELDDDE